MLFLLASRNTDAAGKKLGGVLCLLLVFHGGLLFPRQVSHCYIGPVLGREVLSFFFFYYWFSGVGLALSVSILTLAVDCRAYICILTAQSIVSSISYQYHVEVN